MKGYRSKCWEAFRREVIELDGGRCGECGRSEIEVVLQVHHKIYIPGRLPWQYAYRDCETLCKGCHAAEHGKIPPKTGWKYLGYEDLGAVSANCELCGSNFRYQFFVFHRDWGSLQVGTHCCNALTGTEIASKQLDRQNKYDERKRRFIRSKRWMEISGRFILRQKGIRIEIAKFDHQYHIQLNSYPGRIEFDSLHEAKSHVFDIIEDGSAKEFITRKGEISASDGGNAVGMLGTIHAHRALPGRKTIRLKNYDYSQAGLYFVTICSWKQKCIFGKIASSKMRLNSLGKLLNEQWLAIPQLYSGVELHDHVIMPNHFHGVIELSDSTGAINLAPTIGEIVRRFKARCARKINASSNNSPQKLWQRNYYEHIIRDEKSYLKIIEYIINNPAKWQDDGYYVES